MMDPEQLKPGWNDMSPTRLETAIWSAFTPARVAANDIQQHEWEARTFLNLVQEHLRPQRTVELGSYKGWMSTLLAAVSGEVVSIDTQEYAPPETIAFNLTFLKGDAADAAFVYGLMPHGVGPIDLLFIDDGHYYETIRLEFDLWRQFVRPGGWIAFHDINPLANIGPHGTQPDSIQVPRFWRELKGNKQEIIATDEHSKWMGHVPHGGIGILRL